MGKVSPTRSVTGIRFRNHSVIAGAFVCQWLAEIPADAAEQSGFGNHAGHDDRNTGGPLPTVLNRRRSQFFETCVVLMDHAASHPFLTNGTPKKKL